jgi:hypothetical protein
MKATAGQVIVPLAVAVIAAGAAIGGAYVGSQTDIALPLVNRMLDTRGKARVLVHDWTISAYAMAGPQRVPVPPQPRSVSTTLSPSCGFRPHIARDQGVHVRGSRRSASRRVRAPTPEASSGVVPDALRADPRHLADREKLASVMDRGDYASMTAAIRDCNHVLRRRMRITQAVARRLVTDLLTASNSLTDVALFDIPNE